MINCTWLPELVLYDDYNSWEEYQNELYNIFCNDFKNTYPTFNNMRVKIRYKPFEYGREEGFYHVTCCDYSKTNNRVPDFRRCERIKWIRQFIENYNCNPDLCHECSGIKVWEEPYKMYKRIHILLEEEKYIVVLECRETYCLLITAFYIDQTHTLKKKIEKYNKYIKQKAPH